MGHASDAGGILGFVRSAAFGGLLLLLCTAVTMVLANSPWADAWSAFWHTRLTVGLGDPAGAWVLSKPLVKWVDDALMAVFFFVVGLEVKREFVAGELASVRQAALPIAAAVGGMVVPAGIYLAINAGRPHASAWGIPMATDIAFALGVLALLGSRVPSGLRVFLAALAIVDDLGAVLVIALFYSDSIAWQKLAIGLSLLACSIVLNRARVRHPIPYLLIGIAVWLLFLKSGIHATIAGVLMAFTIPARTAIDARAFVDDARGLLQRFDDAGPDTNDVLTNRDRVHLVQSLEARCEEVQAPLQRLEHMLHPWVTFGVMPIFALANAGVALSEGLAVAATSTVTWGVALGLLVGKPLGVLGACWLALRLRLGAMPLGVGWRHLVGAGFLAGIGFTMALFIAGLAFVPPDGMETPPDMMAKIGILAASSVAGIIGWIVLAGAPRRPA